MASARLPQALIDRVEDWATTSGASRSGAIRKSSRTAGVLVARAGRVAPARAIEGQQETRRRVDEVVALIREVTWAKWRNSTSETGTAPSISIPSTMRQERIGCARLNCGGWTRPPLFFFVKICLAGDGRAGVFPALRRTLSPMPASTMQLPDSDRCPKQEKDL
jgi:hypothetical protein